MGGNTQLTEGMRWVGNQQTIGLIPARKGSKGIPRKNVIDLGDRPLIEWTIAAAKESEVLDRIVVSSDDVEVLEIAQRQELTALVRPSEFASDEATMDSVIRHCVERFPEYENLILLQPTSPFRTSAQIKGSLSRLKESPLEAIISVAKSKEPLELLVQVDANDQLNNIVPTNRIGRRQEFLPTYRKNGAIYAFRIASFLERGSISEMSAEAFYMDDITSIDIDTFDDLEICRNILNQK